MARSKYDSKFEESLHKGPLKGCKFHTERLPYIVEKNYEPDFIRGKYYIEAKGRFRDRQEAAKYLWVRKCLPKGKELVFVFQNYRASMPGSKRRKDGTRQSHGEWADKNNFKWFTPRTVPKSWGTKR